MSEVFRGFVDIVRELRPGDLVIFARVAPAATTGESGEATPVTTAAGPPFGSGEFLPTSRVIHLSADTGEVIVGGTERPGTFRLVNGALAETVTLDARFGNLRLGGNGADGDILLFASAGNRSDNGAATIHLDGEAGDILLRNGDCAEDFEVAASGGVEPGNVLRIADDGLLHVADQPYDRRVAGVVSGAGDTRPGIVLARNPRQHNRLPIALAGCVGCSVDASYGAIATGDLLTTSATPGHAMRADDPSRSFGSVIGKALEPLARGTGLVRVLVSLQ